MSKATLKKFRIHYSGDVKRKVKELFGEKDIYGSALIGSPDLAVKIRSSIKYYGSLSVKQVLEEVGKDNVAKVAERLPEMHDLLQEVCEEIRSGMDDAVFIDLLESTP